MTQARRQDSVRGGARTLILPILEGKFHEFWGEDQKKGLHLTKCAKFHDFRGEYLIKIKVFNSKIARISINSMVKPQNKKVFIAKSVKKQCLLTNSGVTASILGVSGLKLNSSGIELVTFFGAQTSLGGT